MMRNVNGGADSRPSNNALDTINAAASVIASAENRVPQATIQKRRWGSCWSVYWCFGYHRHRKRIGHAVLVPENSAPGNDSSAAENPTTQAPTITLPFVAPPSSPASFLQSEPPSASQSPAGILSLTSVSASMYSPSGPASIFAIGPYAHETQLVSPPAFSTFTTEPSTAPFTPPPESVQLTTPSSPEVPFAQLLEPSNRNGEAGLRFPFSNYEFQSYQFYPGSPVGQLISPSSGISGSGTSSPFPDGEFAAAGPRFLEFQMAVPPKLLNLDKLSVHECGSRQGSGTLTPDAVRATSCSFPLDRQCSDIASNRHSDNENKDDQVADLRVSFDLSAEDALRYAEPKPASPVKIMPESMKNEIAAEKVQKSSEIRHNFECRVGETSNGILEQASTGGEKTPRHQKHRTLTLGTFKEFNFDNADGVPKPSAGPDWWDNGSDVGKEDFTAKNWSFFPVMQPSIG
ncbi:uncharacterized protein LOC8287397 [Ricinus communis]|uniref:Hydroxyproline-rich glycoprotein family protein n=1 Tax=Ricinus communis TaxID=3988 RepID=B9RCD8_RICCO|nr:uncharacterized protein LOC8287397 [Ricinus communis]EEF51209.1 conserved hypothetical protein [Ricinus communis]|eukprot:XP_002509822.1 uncharacterized protein LOC8287397 [Ricinus communis]